MNENEKLAARTNKAIDETKYYVKLLAYLFLGAVIAAGVGYVGHIIWTIVTVAPRFNGG